MECGPVFSKPAITPSDLEHSRDGFAATTSSARIRKRYMAAAPRCSSRRAARLMICGSSSSPEARNHQPPGIRRASPRESNFCIGTFAFISCSKCDWCVAPLTLECIVRNLNRLKRRPRYPIRSCRKRIGPERTSRNQRRHESRQPQQRQRDEQQVRSIPRFQGGTEIGRGSDSMRRQFVCFECTVIARENRAGRNPGAERRVKAPRRPNRSNARLEPGVTTQADPSGTPIRGVFCSAIMRSLEGRTAACGMDENRRAGLTQCLADRENP